MPSYTIFRNPLKLSLFLALLVHVSGAIGIVFFDRQFFVGFTAINLLLMFLLLLWNEMELRAHFLKAFLFAFLVGIFTEIIGVNSGLLFGDYHYGDVFGGKWMGVPILIGLNWFCIVYASFQSSLTITKSLSSNKIAVSLLTASTATAFDWIMEPVAIKLGFWQWHSTEIPILNYASWFFISFGVAYFFCWLGIKRTNPFAVYLLLIHAIFFIFLSFLIS